MRVDRGAVSAITASVVLAFGLAGAGPEGETARLTGPTMVTLDFRNTNLIDVAQAISKRTGKSVSAQRFTFTKGQPEFPRFVPPGEPSWADRKVTLESPEPVPFWAAIDRLAESGGASYRVGQGGSIGSATIAVVFEGPGAAPSPACYAGPFRVGLHGVHEHNDVLLVNGPWVRFFPSGVPMPAAGADLVSWPKDGGPLHIELSIACEPGLVCRRDGRPKALEAVDAQGRSLLAAGREDVYQSMEVFGSAGGSMAPVVRLPLKRPDGSRTIKLLRGVIPVEVAMLKPRPAIVIPVGESAGKTFRDAGVEIAVVKDLVKPDGGMEFGVSCRFTGEEERALRSARQRSLLLYQVRMVDAGGGRVQFASSSSGGDTQGNSTFSFQYTPRDEPMAPPSEFRYYDLDRATFDVPFEFHEIPLP